MKKKNYILDIATELTDQSVLQRGPLSVLEHIKEQFSFLKFSKSNTTELRPDLTRHDYSLTNGDLNLQLSFLFQSQSKRWYVDSIRPVFS